VPGVAIGAGVAAGTGAAQPATIDAISKTNTIADKDRKELRKPEALERGKKDIFYSLIKNCMFELS
jgi:hypothetical protein